MKLNHIYQGDSLEVLKTLPEDSTDCVMTSPPYWALRDYGIEGQLGLEPTFERYVAKLCDIFDEVKRVLKKEGTCWVNLGDTYGGSKEGNDQPKYQNLDNRKSFKKSGGITKSLCMIPFHFAIEMQNRGWILRNVIIWHKPNCMPSSVKDRFTVDFEYLFFFVKSKKYYFETQLEPYIKELDDRWGGNMVRGKFKTKTNQFTMEERSGRKMRPNEEGKNKRTVWTITTKPFKEAHFAAYPEELCETPLKAGCPEFVCSKCGKPIQKDLNNPYVIDTNAKTDGKDNLQTMRKGNTQVRRSQENKAILQQKMQYDLDSTTPKEYNLQNENNKGVCLNISAQSPTSTEVGLYSGTQISNGEEIGETTTEKRNSSSQEWNKRRQQNREFRSNDREYSQSSSQTEKEDNNLSSLSKENENFNKCPFCGSSELKSGVVLDCFFGAGTTGLVALKQNKKFIGIELNPEYIEIALKRLKPYIEQKKLIA